MTRLAARARLQFFPTPLYLIEMIATNIQAGSREGAIVDPCCGNGEPLALLGHKLGLTTYGNELHPDRYREACLRLDYCLNGARELLKVEGLFNVLFNNPPYDEELGGQRMEITHLLYDFTLLAPGGLGIWVIPEPIVRNACMVLAENLKDVTIRRFPLPEYNRFQQVVVFGIRRTKQEQLVTFFDGKALETRLKTGIPILQPYEFSYPFCPDRAITSFEVSIPETTTILEEAERCGAHTSETWQAMLGISRHTNENFRPLLPLGPGHMAFVLAAGLLDGIEIEVEGDPHVIKGTSHKRLKVTSESQHLDNGSDQTITWEKEQIVHIISTLNMADGTLRQYDNAGGKDSFFEFLIDNQEMLVGAIRQAYHPFFDPTQDMAPWRPLLERLQAPGLLPGQLHPSLLPVQEISAAALAKYLQAAKCAILDGEMGIGKTLVAQAVAALTGKGNWKLVVISPAQVLNKWRREAQIVLQAFGVRVHLIGERRPRKTKEGRTVLLSKPVLDTIEAMEEPNPSVLIMSYETAKSGSRWAHAPGVRKKIFRYKPATPSGEEGAKANYFVKEVLCCPDCGQVLVSDKGDVILTEIEQLGNNRQFCKWCKAALWQRIPFEYGGRVAIADFLNQHYRGQYTLVIDEAHRTQGIDTDAGYASADLINSARKVLVMTGTIYGGKASTIFATMYRLYPYLRQMYGYNEVQRFINHNGLREKITTTTKPKRGADGAYAYPRQNVRVREVPGVSPAIVTMLLSNTAFLKLVDLGYNLPPYTESRLPVPLDDRLKPGIKSLNKVYEKAVGLAREGSPALLSAWAQASLSWLDCPVQETLTARNREGEVLDSFTIEGVLAYRDELLETPLPKDRLLLELIREQLGQNRGVGVYFAQVNRRDWMVRIEKLLHQNGIYCEILRQNTCRPQDRESWYRDFVQRCRLKGQEPVLLTNGHLVKEGLDLLELPTLVETGIEYRINDLRQRDRRSWRLRQDRPVEVVFSYYQNSWQEVALQLVAAKLKAALLVDGGLIEGLAAMEADEDNLLEVLMKAVIKGQDTISTDLGWNGMEVFNLWQGAAGSSK